MLAGKGISTFSEALGYVKHLPYGRNTSRTDFSLVISENKGSCSSKHAFLKALADENQVPDVTLFIGIYQMNGVNTPKTAAVLSANNIDFIPEAHCYLKIGNDYIDATSPTACFENIKSVILEEITIVPSQVGDFKISYHQAFLKKWLYDNQSAFTFTDFWNIREQCIESLSSQIKMKTIRIAGVPEHFNLPWHLSIDNNEFEREDIDLQWTDVPEGTGKLCQMLRNNETDIAVILTEGIVKDIVAGNPSKIVQIYVESPLIWGIHVAANSKYKKLSELKNTKVAISRPGSGSQLMAYVNAGNHGWDVKSLQFETINTIDGAVTALTNGTADYFMWERFMTKPLVDNGTFRRIADCPTPWPCFVIAVTDELLERDPKIIRKILRIINERTKNFKETPHIDITLSDNYHQKIKDIREWLSLTKWSQKQLSEQMLNNVQNQLLTLSIIDKKGTFAEIVKS